MAWLRSAMNKAAEVSGRSSFGDVVRSHTGYISLPGNAVFNDAKKLIDRVKARNMNSHEDAIRRLEEVSVSSKGEERVQLLRKWLVSLKESERRNTGSAENSARHSEEFHTSIDINNSTVNPDVVLCYDPDLGVSPVNFRDIFLHSQALEGITMSMIVGAPNEEEILLLHELYGLCLTGGEEVHDVIVKRILDFSKAFSVYDEEVLAKRKELLQFAQDAISGLKLNAEILRIDSEVSEIHKDLKELEHHEIAFKSNPSSLDATNDITLEVIKESVSSIRLCCRLESLLLRKKLLNSGDTPEDHSCKVDKLKVLSESLLSSASKTEKRILDDREQKEEALYFRVAKTSEVTQIEKELGAEIHELEKQRDKLETELIKVKSLLAAANGRLENATEEREQFDDANNQLLVHFKSKEDELSKAIVSYKAEADTCSACVEFLEAAWDFQSSFMEKTEKKVNDELETHEEYFVHVAKKLLSAYKDALPPAIAILKEHMNNLKRYEKAIDPDEEFLQDIEQRKGLEDAYIAAETKVIAIFDAASSVKDQFYQATDNVFKKGIEPVNELCEAIEIIKSDFESTPRPYLGSDMSTLVEQEIVSKESPQKGVSPSSKSVLTVDIKSILTQKLTLGSPKKKAYIPLGASSENSPSNPVPDNDQADVHVSKDDNSSSTPNKEIDKEIEKENGEELMENRESSVSQPCTSDNEKLLEPSRELEKVASELSGNNDEKSVDPNSEMVKVAPETSKTKQHNKSSSSESNKSYASPEK